MLAALPEHAAILIFAAASRLIARLPPARLEGVLEPKRRPARVDEQAIARVAQRVERVLSRSEPVLRHHCLTRGLTRYYFLRRAGADVRLVFGVGELGGRAEGHCWIVRDGEVYRETTPPEDRFVPVYSIPSR